MGLFDAKICAICGEKIGLFGNRKVEDGNVCKNCASKLSPWFSERRKSTVEDIKKQLAYREENRKALDNFHPTKTLGNRTKVYIDENAGTFVVSRAKDFRSDNADIIKLSQVMNAEYTIDEEKEEIYTKDDEGNRVSYDPAQYNYEYEFEVTLNIDSPYFNEIEFEVSDSRPTSKGSTEYKELKNICGEIVAVLKGKEFTPEDTTPDPEEKEEDKKETTEETTNELWECPKCHIANRGKFCIECGTPKPIYKCPKCGWSQDDHNRIPKFCPECGTTLNNI